MPAVKQVSATGFDGRVNKLEVVLREQRRGRNQSGGTMVIFSGDISASKEEMLEDPEAEEWKDWSTEAIALLMARRFPNLNIVLVRPSRMREGFSCFDHFLTTNINGDPLDGDYNPEGSAIKHLLLLLKDLARITGVGEQLLSRLYLVGFSKGCVVVNQILAELGAETSTDDAMCFLGMTRAIAWLDPGVNEGSCVFVTDEEVLSTAAKRLRSKSAACLYVVFSPFQLYLDSYEFEYEDDEAATSEELGLDLLQSIMKEGRVPLELEYCLFDQEPTLLTHFKVLQEFTSLRHLNHLDPKAEMSSAPRRHMGTGNMARAITSTLSRSCELM
ncbi:unnamed protein product [Effrenium voratum]|nr:unnamed protein product [Effrenium voratum]|mmetsp:Transcript_7573/g.18151  ORF Transcript_7573/g.18151 Transcript_7573/m.18151 type:complete len:330 (-) Transcript_7573:297-1286(-)